MAFTDLREFLKVLAGLPGELLEIEEPVDPEYEAAAVLGYRPRNGPAVLLRDVARYPGWRIVGNVLGTRRRVALALGVGEEDLIAEYFRRRCSAIPPKEVPTGPVKEVVITAPLDLKDYLPVPTFHEGDAGPYVTAGVCIARDKASGRYHLGIHRIQLKGGNRLGIFLANPPLATWLESRESCGERLEIAIAVGVDPAVLLAAVTRSPVGPDRPDKMSIAGSLRGEPVELVPCETVDLRVPATAELVIEGRIVPGRREKEGPFGETSGYYFTFDNPVLEVTAICHRKAPIYQAIVPGTDEAETIVGLSSVSELIHRLREALPGFCGFALIPGTCGFHGALSLKKKTKAEARQAALLALSLDPRLKQVTVVDDDVDVHSPEDVTWAAATRCRPDEDIIVLPRLPGYPIDPASDGSSTAKVIVDATKPEAETERFRRAVPHPSAVAKAEGIWKRHLQGGRNS
ncbi:MAG: UbiD family decarboxylase [Clostridia bacterium]|nr:UbiD family decarboxylase [Clostridia bacterium]MDH7572092.1 UbiD family decarboxylase [Clostridia bacterium]